MNLTDWAARWGLPPEAIEELSALCTYAPPADAALSEAGVQSRVRLAAASQGVLAWRNNVGAGKLENGSFLRWGLANDSAALNDVCKSADLIGIKRRLITTSDVGTVIGQFWSRESKRSDWVAPINDPAHRAQLAWAAMINSRGGDAKIVTSP